MAKGYVVTAESPGGEHERPEAFAVKLQQSHPAWVVAAFSEAVYLDALMSSDSRFEKVLWGVMLRVNRK